MSAIPLITLLCNTSSWDIVIWEEEDAVDFVPSCWAARADKSAYKYPIGLNQHKRRQIIYECKNLQTNYKISGAKCIKEGVKDLKKAQNYCKQGLYTSHLDSSDPGSSGADDNDDRGRKRKKNSKIQELTQDKSESSDDSNVGAVRKKTFVFPQSRDSPLHKKVFVDHSNPSSPGSSVPPPHIMSNNEKDVDKFMKTINRDIKDIKYTMNEMEKKINKIHSLVRSKQTEILLKDVDFNSEESDFLTLLPCETQTDIEKLDNILKTEPENRKQLVHILYLVGGDTIQKTVNFSMAKILGKQIALSYSGQGKKKKLPFCSLALYEVVMEAVRKRHKDASDEGIKRAISQFLATSKSRLPPSLRNNNTLEDPSTVS